MDSSDPPSALSLRSHSVSARCGMVSPLLHADCKSMAAVTRLRRFSLAAAGRQVVVVIWAFPQLTNSAFGKLGSAARFWGGLLIRLVLQAFDKFSDDFASFDRWCIGKSFPTFVGVCVAVAIISNFFFFFQMKEMERNTRKEGIVCLQTSFFTDFFTEAATF